MTYGADLTPALAVLLTAILDALRRRHGRMIVVVDEAHRITSDPDAGEVLGQLVRQARKHGAGVWMLSQRVEDFVRTDLGRTLTATSSSKLVLGTEEAVVDDVRDVFKLRDEEMTAICPVGARARRAARRRRTRGRQRGPGAGDHGARRHARRCRARGGRHGGRRGDLVLLAAPPAERAQRAPAPRVRVPGDDRAGGAAGAGADLRGRTT